MPNRLALLLLPVALTACAGAQPRLPEAKGPIRPLNVGRWQPEKADLRGLRAPLPRSPHPTTAETRR